MIRTKKTIRRYVRDIQGANAVEFALIMPLLLISIFGLFHVSIFFFGTHQAQRATEKTSREVRLMNLPTIQSIEDSLKAQLEKPIGGTYSQVITKVDEHGGTFADIRVSYEYVLPIPMLGDYTFRSQSGTRILLRDLS